MYHGDFALGKTFDIKFTTRRFSTGAPYTLAGTPSVAAYPDNSTTEVTAGITLTVDFDSRTGLNNVRVVATSGNGYVTGTNYTLVITAGTVDSVSVVGECVGSFSIEARSALRPTTADRTLVVDAAGLADANAVKIGPSGSGTSQTARDIGASVLLSPGTGTGQVDLTSGVAKANVTQLLGTAWLTPAVAGTPDVNAKQLGGTAQTARDIGASVLLSAGTGTGQLDFTNGVVKSNLVQIVATALTETSAGYLAAAFKKLFDVAAPVLTAASVNQTGDSYARLGAPAGASVSADVAAVKTDTGNLVTRITSTLFSGITSLKEWLGLLAGKQVGNSTARTELRASGAGSGTFDETTDSLEALRDNEGTAGANLTIAAVTGAVGSVTGAVGSVTGNVGGNVTGSIGSIATGGIAAASFAAGAIDAAAIAADAIGSSELAASAVAEIQSGLATSTAQTTAQTSLDAISSYVDTEVAAIKAKTDQLTFTNANKVDSSLQAANDIANIVAQKLAHIILRRTMTNVQASSDGDTVNTNSLYGLVQQAQKASLVGTTLTIKNPDGTTLGTATVTTDGTAELVTAIA